MSSPQQNRGALERQVMEVLRESSGLGVLFSQAIADRVGMNPTDLETLDVLIRSGPMTAGQLAARTGLTTGAITGLIDRLERRGYARRERHPTDRRSVLVRPLIDAAERDLLPAYAGMSASSAALLDTYSDDDLVVILDFVTRAAAMTVEQIARLREETARREVSKPA